MKEGHNDKREIWPDGYREPNWIYSLTSSIPTSPPSSWPIWWSGVISSIAVISCLGFGPERIQISEPLRILIIFGAAIVAIFGWLSAGGPGSWKRVLETSELWLKEKARAESYARRWSEEELSELENLIRWNHNYHENRADEDRDRRMSRWWYRVFCAWVNEGKPIRASAFVSQQDVYLANLLTEIRQRQSEEQREQRLAEDEYQQIKEAALEKAERESLGEELWSARNLARDEAEETVADAFGGWNGFSEIEDLLHQIINKIVKQGTAAALDASDDLRLEVWSNFWTTNWTKAVAAAKDLEGKELALVNQYDIGRSLEMKYWEGDPERMTPADTERWEQIENEYRQRENELKAEVAMAERELKAMFDLAVD